MPDFYDIDRANARLPELNRTLQVLLSLRLELVQVRDRIVTLNLPQPVTGGPSAGSASSPAGSGSPQVEAETSRLRMRMQGLVDQMQAAVIEVDSWGIVLRDIQTGLVDFPALVAGRQVWLCWRLGEDEVGWWHELSEGFGGRRRLEDLV
ncbi:MAG TPA: DUF2203 domain-containing protein [Candidatus Limnocylindrales bacterium]|jgi:hypothetical protein